MIAGIDEGVDCRCDDGLDERHLRGERGCGEWPVVVDRDLGDGAGDAVVKYTTQGAMSLGGTVQCDDLEEGADWAAQGYRFIRVKVEMP